ncbi:MAG: winged helix DNA-binding protein [Candidatus Nanohaloarchaea archaeon]
MGEHDLEEFFLNTKPVKILVKLRQQTSENYASALSTQVNATYSHTVKVLQKMKEYGLVEFDKKGRKKEVSLTDRGAELAEDFHEILQRLKD